MVLEVVSFLFLFTSLFTSLFTMYHRPNLLTRYLGNVYTTPFLTSCTPTHARSDFAEQYPQAEVIGSDLSPCQPQWVPPNLHFEVDDATLAWTRKDNTFDFIHIRYLFGAIRDWTGLFREAYRTCAPGGWLQSCEADIEFLSDDDTVDLEPALKTWTKLYEEGGTAMGRPFFVQKQNLQERGLVEAGFVDIKSIDYKVCSISNAISWCSNAMRTASCRRLA